MAMMTIFKLLYLIAHLHIVGSLTFLWSFIFHFSFWEKGLVLWILHHIFDRKWMSL